MRIVIALGGNALARRGEPMTVDVQKHSIARVGVALRPILAEHDIVVSHGNGPQVGLLALQAAAYDESSGYPFDILGAQTDGMIGYLVEQELRNQCPPSRVVSTLLTMIEVDPDDRAFTAPTKFVGPVYDRQRAQSLAAAHGWTIAPDGDAWRRTVPSPMPQRILELRAIEWLLDQHAIVVCAGGGGIPTVRDPLSGRLIGVEAVVDKDRTSAVLAQAIDADLLVLATDADGVYDGWGTTRARRIRSAHPDALVSAQYAAGSMRPKVEAAAEFARSGRGEAVIGALSDVGGLVAGKAGTRISTASSGSVYWADALIKQ